MKNKYTKIRFASKYYTDNATGTIIPVFGSKRVMNTSTRRFNNNLHKTASLPNSARNLLDYMIQKIDEKNEIENSYLFREEFINFMSKNCGIKYKEDTVNKGFQKLKKADLLVSFDVKRAVYIVNPLYFYSGSESKRKILLQTMLNATPNGKYKNTNLKSAMEQ